MVNGPFVLPLAFGQGAQYLAQLVVPELGRPLVLAYALHGPLETLALHRACGEIVARHQALRATFDPQHPDDWQQTVVPPSQAFVRVFRQQVTADEEQFDRYADRLVDADADGWDIWNHPQFRFRLLRRTPTEHRLYVLVQHLVADGRSMAILHRDLWACYAAFAGGSAPPPADAGPTYADVVQRQHRESGGRVARNTAYWQRKAAAAPPACQIVPSPGGPEGPGEWHSRSLVIAGDELTALRTACLNLGAGAFEWIVAGLAMTLSGLTGQDRVSIFANVDSRTAAERDVVGLFAMAHQLLLRRSASLADAVSQVRTELIRCLAAQHASAELVRSTELRHAYETGVAPARSLVVDYQRANEPPMLDDPIRVGDLKIERLVRPAGGVRPYPMRLSVLDHPDRIVLEFDSDSTVLPATRLDEFWSDFGACLRSTDEHSDEHPPDRRDVGLPHGLLALGDGATVHVSPEAVAATISAHPDVRAVEVAIVDEPSGVRRVVARVAACLPLTDDDLRAHCYAKLARSPYDVVPYRFDITSDPGPAREQRPPGPLAVQLLAVVRQFLPTATFDDRFWHLGGTFATIRSIRHSAFAAGLPVPRYDTFVPDLSLGRILGSAPGDGWRSDLALVHPAPQVTP